MKLINKLKNKYWKWFIIPDISDVILFSEITEEEQKRVDLMKELIDESLKNQTHHTREELGYLP